MKKKTKVILSAASVLAVAGIIAGSYFINNDKNPEVTPVPTTAPTEAAPSPDVTITETPVVDPTSVPTVETTTEPTVEPTIEPIVTVEPTKEAEVEPTETPDITVTETPVPEPTATVKPTETPAPSPTNTPIPTSKPTQEPISDIEIAGYTLTPVQKFQLSDTTYAYVFQGGSIGVIDTKTGFNDFVGNVISFKKTPENVDITTVAGIVFNYSSEVKPTIDQQYLPTPTPTPTTFPTPNPEQPKMLASYKGDKSYGDVTIEVWDNGYMYIKGTGTLSTDAICGMGYTSPDCKEFISIYNSSKVVVNNYIIGEGIVDLDDWAWLPSHITYLELPSTLKEVSGKLASNLKRNPRDVKIVGYKDGQKVTYDYKSSENFTKVLEEYFNIQTN